MLLTMHIALILVSNFKLNIHQTSCRGVAKWLLIQHLNNTTENSELKLCCSGVLSSIEIVRFILKRPISFRPLVCLIATSQFVLSTFWTHSPHRGAIYSLPVGFLIHR